MRMVDRDELMKGFRIGQWTILPERGLMRVDVDEEHIEPKVMEVLVLLAAANGEVVSKQQLMDEVWGDSPSGDEVITRCIAVLRSAFQDDARQPQTIETLSRRGYRLMIPVSGIDDGPIGLQTSKNRALLIAAAMAVVALVVVFVWRGFPGKARSGTAPVQSIAVFPFVCQGNLDADDQYLCTGISDVLISTLLEAGDLRVVKMRTPLPDEAPQDVADDLDVDGLITGTVHRLNERYQISGAMLSGLDGATVWARSFDSNPDELFEAQEKLARDLLGELTREEVIPLHKSRRPSSSQAFDHYLRGQYQLERRSRASIEEAIQLFEQTISLDPQFSPAYLQQGYAYLILPDYAPELPDASMFELAAVTIAAGIEVDAGLESQGKTVDAYRLQKQGEWALAADAFAAATASESADPIAHSWYSRLLANTGRLDDSLASAQRAMQMDPNSPVIISRVAIANFWVGNDDAATLYFGMVDQMTFGAPIHDLAYALFLIRQERVDEARRHAKAGMEKYGLDASWVDPVFDGISDPQKAEQAIALLGHLSDTQQLPRFVELTLWMIFGDTDRAMQAAMQLQASEEIFEIEIVFSDAFAELRNHPDFPLLLDQTGLTDYWRTLECSWDGQTLSCP